MRTVRDEPAGTSGADGRVRARLVTYGCVVAILVSGFMGLELWPLSTFRLFSEVRSSSQYSWELSVIDTSGVAREVNLGALPDNYSGHAQLITQLDGMSAEQQEATVRAWLEGANVDQSDLVAARVLLVESQVSTTVGEPPVEQGQQEVAVVSLQ